jgi:hypothetical protein
MSDYSGVSLPADVSLLLREVLGLPGVVGHLSLDVASIPADVGTVRREVVTYLRRRSLISIICTCCDSYRVKSLSTAWRRSRSPIWYHKTTASATGLMADLQNEF